MIGVPVLETGRFLHNQLSREWSIQERAERIRARVRVFSEVLGIPSQAVMAAGLVDVSRTQDINTEMEEDDDDDDDDDDEEWMT